MTLVQAKYSEYHAPLSKKLAEKKCLIAAHRGSWGGNITSENITYKHFINTTWVSEFFPPKRPSDEEIFGAYFASGKKDR